VPGLRSETTPAEKEAIERAVVARLLQYAAEKKISNPVIRDILPNEDLLGAGEVGSGHIWQQDISSLQYHTVYSGTNDDDRAFAIYKISNAGATPLTVAIRFWKGTGQTAIKDIWQAEMVWLNKDKEEYCDPEAVIFYGVNEGFNIDFMAGPDSGMDNVILGGKVVEPKGKVLVPKVPFT